MKREGKLIEKIADPENLRLAYWKARKSKESRQEVVEFGKSLEKNLLSLREALLCGGLRIGQYRCFTIYDPKERLICSAPFRERVLHHAIMNVCHENFEKYQIYDSYASRKGKGTYAALARAGYYQRKYRWFLKMDVRKFFDSIDHKVLKRLLLRRFKDAVLLEVFSKIIDSYQVVPGQGLPIGNLTSQYFANHYLALADHYIKDCLRALAYVRYMDDMVIWSDDKKRLLEIGHAFRSFIERELALSLKPFCLNATAKGLPFLGYLLYPDRVMLNKHSKKRFTAKYMDYTLRLQKGIWSQWDYQAHILPLLAFVRYANTYHLRSKYIGEISIG